MRDVPRRTGSVIAAVLIGMGMGAMVARAETQSSQVLKAKGQTTATEPKINTQLLDKKLDQVLDGQQKILNQLDVMMEELRIIKMRATR